MLLIAKIIFEDRGQVLNPSFFFRQAHTRMLNFDCNVKAL